jgi:hypothetical protein
MANIKDDPKVQDLTSKLTAKAEREQVRAVTAANKAVVAAAKGAFDEVDPSDEDPKVARVVNKYLREAKRAVVEAAKAAA